VDATDIETAIAFVKARQEDMDHQILGAIQAAVNKFTAETGLAPHAVDVAFENLTPINSKTARVIVRAVRTRVNIAPPTPAL
jgi:predicted amino acid dehydrogenase